MEIERNRCLLEENWLEPVDPEMAYRFMKEKAGLVRTSSTTISIKKLDGYGFAYSIEGYYKKNGQLVYRTPFFGEFGPVYGFDGDWEDNIEKLINKPEQVYLDWISLVAKANEGRTINGKTYLESLKETILAEISNQRDKKIAKAHDEANKNAEIALKLVSSLKPETEDFDEAELPF